LWCEVSVRILWKDIWSFIYSSTSSTSYKHRRQVESAVLSTLIACLPSESKELLHKNEIFIAAPTSKPLLFNYAAFCKVLSINNICLMVNNALKNNPHITTTSLVVNLKDKNRLIIEEIIKLF